MSLNSINKELLSTLKLFNIAVILGILFGIFFAALHILRNGYIDYKVYNIALLDLRANLNEYLLIFILIALGLVIINKVVSGIFLKGYLKKYQEKNSDKNIPAAISYSLTLIFILAVITFSIYPDIISFLKSTSLAEQLHKFTASRSGTYRIFIVVFAVSGLIFFALITYILSKYKLTSIIQSSLFKIANSRPLHVLGPSILGLVILFNLFMLGYSHASAPEGPNIIVISIDTLRADHMSSYGYGRDTTPNIDELAEKGILFENAYSQGSWTYPSMASMHTSLYPTQIGVDNLDTKIHDSFMTLAEYIKNNFYNTHAVISNLVVSKPLGFAQGFDTFNEDPIRNYGEITSHLVTEQAIEYLKEMKGNSFFLWLHYMDPHLRHVHHLEYNYSKDYTGGLSQKMSGAYLNSVKESLDEEDIRYIKDLYDEEISYTDNSIGRLLNTLEELGLMDNTVIILTADHGEEFMERNNFGHGETLFQELIHVPLIIYVPSNKDIGGKRVKSSVEVKSIGRTVLDLSGIVNTQFQGQNLLIAAEDEGSESYSYTQMPNGEEDDPRSEAIISDNWKLIKDYRLGKYQLYDLESDPGEKNDVFNEEQNGVNTRNQELLSKLSEINKERIGTPDEVEFKEEDIRRLKALGYIQ